MVLEQLALEAHAVRADARSEREPEVGAGGPTRREAQLQQRLLEARCREALAPLTDGLEVVEAPARRRHHAEVRLRARDDLLEAEGEPGAGKLVTEEGEVPRVRLVWCVDVDRFERD